MASSSSSGSSGRGGGRGVTVTAAPLLLLLLLLAPSLALRAAPSSSCPRLSQRRPLSAPGKDVGESVVAVLAPPIVQGSSSQLPAASSTTTLTPSIPTQTQRAETTALLFLLFSVAVLNNLDRISMAVSIIPMSEEFGYTGSERGLIGSFFSLGYLAGILPAGYAGSASSPKRVMAVGVLLWSAAQMSAPAAAASSINALLATRFLMGASESVTIPLVQTFISRFSPESERTTNLALVFSGLNVGSVLAYIISPIVLEAGGWQAPFFDFGALGFVWLLFWLPLAKDYPSSTSISSGSSSGSAVDVKAPALELGAGAGAVQESALQENTTIEWVKLFKDKNFQAIVVAHSCANVGLYFYLNYLPSYFSSLYHGSLEKSSLSAVLPAVASALMGILAGKVADTLIARGVDKTLVRRSFQSVAFLVPAFTLIYLAHSRATDGGLLPSDSASLTFSLATGFASFSVAGYSTSLLDICKPGSKLVSILYSLTSAPAVLAGSLGIWATGKVLDSTGGDWDVLLNGIAAVYIFGAAFFATRFEVPGEESQLL